MKKLIALILTLALLTLSFAACNREKTDETDNTVIKIAYMNGPTGMGMAKLIHDNGGVDGNEKYQFIKYSDAALATSDLKEGKIDMACIPTNTAATLYNKTDSIKVLALNCLNSLYIMTKTGVTVKDLSDLEGKTVYTISNGTPAAILRHLLAESDVNATVRTSMGEGEDEKELTSPNDLAAQLIAGKIDIDTDTGDVKFNECDANEIVVETDTGFVKGSLLSGKNFFVETDTGKTVYPKDSTGGRCQIETDTGNIEISIVNK